MAEIDSLIVAINRRLKAEVLIKGSALLHQNIQRCTTGSLVFDLMLGGGWPLNVWNEVIGQESSAKTTTTLKMIAANQKLNPNHHTLWVAAEDFNNVWAETLGVDLSKMTFAFTNVMEEAYEICREALQAQAVDAMVIDSYPALVPQVEEDKKMEDLVVGKGAQLTNKFMRLSLAAQRRSLTEVERPCLAIMINQWREMIGAYGDPRTTPGGKGKNYAYATRVEFAREEWLRNSQKIAVGIKIKARTIKNKTAPPNRSSSLDFYFSDHHPHLKGDYDVIQEVFNVALELDVITRRGAYYDFDSRTWQGKDKLWEDMKQEPPLVGALDAQVRHRMLGTPIPEPARTRVVKKRG